MDNQPFTKSPDQINVDKPSPGMEPRTGGLPSRLSLIAFFGASLGISFFLPWFVFFGSPVSGFRLSKEGGLLLMLWILPAFSCMTIYASLTKQNAASAAVVTGLIPIAILAIGIAKIGPDLLQILQEGAYFSLCLGVALICLGESLRRQ